MNQADKRPDEHGIASGLFWCAFSWHGPELFMSSLIPFHQVLIGQPNSMDVRCYIAFSPVQSGAGLRSAIWMFHLNLPFSIASLTGSNPNSSLSSTFFFLSSLRVCEFLILCFADVLFLTYSRSGQTFASLVLRVGSRTSGAFWWIYRHHRCAAKLLEFVGNPCLSGAYANPYQSINQSVLLSGNMSLALRDLIITTTTTEHWI